MNAFVADGEVTGNGDADGSGEALCAVAGDTEASVSNPIKTLDTVIART